MGLATAVIAKTWPDTVELSDKNGCKDYVEKLQAAGARISMSGKGRPRDNAQAESFFRTLKVEEV